MEKLVNKLEKCDTCPHSCNANRMIDIGRCKAGKNIKISLYSLHKFEEPCISGKNGSGTIFFSNCNLNCVFCQNYEISQLGRGKEISIEELAEIFLIQQNENNAHNINLVSPTIYAYQIIESIKIAKKKGLKIPIIYNSNGFENIETLKALEGYIDVYLPDLKYYYNELGLKYSKVNNYFETATSAIKEMYRQVGNVRLDEEGIIKKGVIIRHLILPNHIQNSKKILKWIKENMKENTYISIMAQYFPTYQSKKTDLNRKLTIKELEKIENYIQEIGLENGYIQELSEHEEEYVPIWKW
jgi:putative pyruvate formate lyase activating enzyme